MADSKKYQLRKGAKFSLFVSSYLPLFALLISRQLLENYNFLNWGGINVSAIYLFISMFGLSVILIMISIVGLIGLFFLLRNLKIDVKNGYRVKVVELQNRNSEAISYISTYIVPFLFQRYSDFYELISICFLLLIIYQLYINSTLLLVNPLLGVKYALYELKFDDKSGVSKSGMVITKNKYLEESNSIKIYPIGHKLYFSEI